MAGHRSTDSHGPKARRRNWPPAVPVIRSLELQDDKVHIRPPLQKRINNIQYNIPSAIGFGGDEVLWPGIALRRFQRRPPTPRNERPMATPWG